MAESSNIAASPLTLKFTCYGMRVIKLKFNEHTDLFMATLLSPITLVPLTFYDIMDSCRQK